MRKNKLLILLFAIITAARAATAEDTEMQLQPDPEESTPPAQIRPMKKNVPPPSTPQKSQGNKGGFYSLRSGTNDTQVVKKKETKADKQAAANKMVDEIPLPYAKAEDGEQTILPMITQKAIVSNMDINWVLCRDTITEFICDDDKDLEVKNKGDHAILKYKHGTTGGEDDYASSTTACSVKCGDVLFRLVAVPLPLPAQTIHLDSSKVTNIRQNSALFRDETTNKKIMKLMQMVNTDDIPKSFTVKPVSRAPLTLFKDLAVIFTRTITVDGEGIIVKEFVIVPEVDGIDLREKSFLRREISTNPLAIAFEPGKTKPSKGERVRMFVIELSVDITNASGGPDVHH
jgi:conjugal transfer pilus assembly protein TraK